MKYTAFSLALLLAAVDASRPALRPVQAHHSRTYPSYPTAGETDKPSKVPTKSPITETPTKSSVTQTPTKSPTTKSPTTASSTSKPTERLTNRPRPDVVNAPPLVTAGTVVAVDDAANIPMGTIDAFIGVLENDTGSNLHVQAITSQANDGSCSIGISLSEVVYSVNDPSFVGSDQCTYEACTSGDKDDCDTADVVIVIKPPIITDRPTRYPTPSPTSFPTTGPTTSKASKSKSSKTKS